MVLAVLDFDRFKLINDVYGRAASDEVLRQACDRVSGAAFIVAMPATSMTLAAPLCRAIVEWVGTSPYLVGDQAFNVRVVAHGCGASALDEHEAQRTRNASATEAHRTPVQPECDRCSSRCSRRRAGAVMPERLAPIPSIAR